MKGFYMSASGAIQGHHGRLVTLYPGNICRCDDNDSNHVIFICERAENIVGKGENAQVGKMFLKSLRI